MHFFGKKYLIPTLLTQSLSRFFFYLTIISIVVAAPNPVNRSINVTQTAIDLEYNGTTITARIVHSELNAIYALLNLRNNDFFPFMMIIV